MRRLCSGVVFLEVKKKEKGALLLDYMQFIFFKVHQLNRLMQKQSRV